MPIGKIGSTAGKGADYSAGSQNIQHIVEQTGQAGANLGISKATSGHSYGAGAMNIEAQTNVPKVKENLGYGKSELSGQSAYGADAVNLQASLNAPKPKTEGLGHVDKKQEAKT